MKSVSVKFLSTFKINQFYTSLDFKIGERVLVETEEGLELGIVTDIKQKRGRFKEAAIRKVAKEDEEKMRRLGEKEKEAFLFCREKIEELGLAMKLIKVSLSLDEKKIVFYYTAEGRVDFRDLLRELVVHFHKNIRLQQIGPRDAAAMLGGLGPCGRAFCCTIFQEDINSITLDLAKEQDLLGVGTSKISGPCGKLLCCLLYEAKLYQELKKKLPQIGEVVFTKKGKGKVISQSVLRQTVLVELEDGTKIEQKYPAETNQDKGLNNKKVKV